MQLLAFRLQWLCNDLRKVSTWRTLRMRVTKDCRLLKKKSKSISEILISVATDWWTTLVTWTSRGNVAIEWHVTSRCGWQWWWQWLKGKILELKNTTYRVVCPLTFCYLIPYARCACYKVTCKTIWLQDIGSIPPSNALKWVNYKVLTTHHLLTMTRCTLALLAVRFSSWNNGKSIINLAVDEQTAGECLMSVWKINK